jgi:hypothetical protein
VKGPFRSGKVTGAWSWQLPSRQWRIQERMDLYIHSSVSFHDVLIS